MFLFDYLTIWWTPTLIYCVVEISRLENSLAHLNHTQIFLREHISEEHGEEDQGLTDALKENDEVMYVKIFELMWY